MPVHDRHEVQEAASHRDVRNVGRPQLIRARNRLDSQQMRIRLMPRVRLTRLPFLSNRHQPHLAHESTYAIRPDEMSCIPQGVARWPEAEERILHEQLVDALGAKLYADSPIG